MSKLQFTLVSDEDNESVTVFIPGQGPKVADNTHPNFSKIREGVIADDPSVYELFDVAQTVGLRLEPLSDRVRVANGRVYFDGDEIDNSCTRQIVRVLNMQDEDYRPLVNFLEKVQDNPTEHSRKQLYSFLEANGEEFSITENGDIIGYKGVLTTNEDDVFESSTRGTAIVDGVVVEGKIPNKIGSVIEMPRSEVAADPSEACSVGLHVATHGFANGFLSHGTVLEVHVNPRDVVSVPSDHNAQKVRVCRYWVEDVVDAPYETPIVFEPEVDPEDEERPEYKWAVVNQNGTLVAISELPEYDELPPAVDIGTGPWAVQRRSDNSLVSRHESRKSARKAGKRIPEKTRVRYVG